MEVNFFDLVVNTIIFFIYGSACFISLIFTVSLEYYERLNNLMNLEFFSIKMVQPIESNIDKLDLWLMSHNRIVGPLFIIVTLLEMRFFFNIINNL